jgi:hypothetical protein
MGTGLSCPYLATDSVQAVVDSVRDQLEAHLGFQVAKCQARLYKTSMLGWFVSVTTGAENMGLVIVRDIIPNGAINLQRVERNTGSLWVLAKLSSLE